MDTLESLPSLETARKLGLLPEEFDRIAEILGRQPNFTELSIFSVMWSEHYSYKNSIVWLKTLPRDSNRTLAKAGEENAGLVDIGDGLACSFRIESHNYPSALEPNQGAVTGVGGINRGLFTMGARPIAQFNSLRLGDLALPKTRQLLCSVVKGIGDYSKVLGIPTVGDELFFDDCYNTHPLVNTFSAGIVEVGKSAKAISFGVGNPVFIVGSATGKDGIHGDTLAPEDISAASTDELSAVQVGDPSTEKLLLEATLEIMATGYVIGIQAMGAAGIICSTAEMSAKGEHGMIIDLDEVPTRQPDLAPFEILSSGSQERMLVVIEKGKEPIIQEIFDKWNLNCAQIGEVTARGEQDLGRLHFYRHGKLVADVPAYDLMLGGGAPQYNREYKEPAYIKEYAKFDIDDVDDIEMEDIREIAGHLLAHPNICSRKWVYEQYDSMGGSADRSPNAPSNAAVVRVNGPGIPATDTSIVITVGCNSRYVNANPRQGTMIAIAQACRNIVCSGGEPLAVTSNLNVGNPYVPEVYWQFVEAVQGMGEACRRFSTPVTGSNVSFYNQSADDGPVFPTPTIGMLGLMEDPTHRMTLDFKNEGDLIYLIGQSTNDLASSEYLYSFLDMKASPAPYFEFDDEWHVQEGIKTMIRKGWIQSAHDVSDGGLFVTLAESAMAGNKGFAISSDDRHRLDSFLFGESQSRVVVTISPEQQTHLEGYLHDTVMPFMLLGTVTDSSAAFVIDGTPIITLAEAKELYDNALGKLMAHP
ncbi:phosphoribosylformylglycinamidine synthase subunit PurL [Spirosoma humi]